MGTGAQGAEEAPAPAGWRAAVVAFRYRNFSLPVSVLAGALTGLGAAIFDFFVWNGDYALWNYRIPYLLLTVVSCAIIAGAGSWALVRSLAPTGVLDRFGAGRERALV